MTPIMIGIYAVFSLLVGVAGRNTRVGAFGVFLLAVLFTPIIVGLVLSIVRQMPVIKRDQHPE